MDHEKLLRVMSIEELYGAYWKDEPYAPKGILELGYARLGRLPADIIDCKVLANMPHYYELDMKIEKVDDNDSLIELIYGFKHLDFTVGKLIVTNKVTDVGNISLSFTPRLSKRNNGDHYHDRPNVLIPSIMMRDFLEGLIKRTDKIHVVNTGDGYNGFGFTMGNSGAISFVINSYLYQLEY